MRKIISDPTYDVPTIRSWMACYAHEYEYSTQLAESCADALDMYEERIHYTIPELVYEIAMEFYQQD